MKLTFVATTFGCESTRQPDPPRVVVEEESCEPLYDQFRVVPAVAPKYVQPPPAKTVQPQPQPQPKPQPQIKPKPRPRPVHNTICGHAAPPNATPDMLMVRCGKG